MGDHKVLAEVFEERLRQDDKWGEQNHPDFDRQVLDWSKPMIHDHYGILQAQYAKFNCDNAFRSGRPDWISVLIEEVSEVLDCVDRPVSELRDELIQVAAVAVSWVEAIDRREDRG